MVVAIMAVTAVMDMATMEDMVTMDTGTTVMDTISIIIMDMAVGMAGMEEAGGGEDIHTTIMTMDTQATTIIPHTTTTTTTMDTQTALTTTLTPIGTITHIGM